MDDGDLVSGPGAAQFIEVSREGFERGVSILHFLGGFTCDVAGAPGDRADEDDHQPARHGRRAWSSTSSAPGASTTSSRSAATERWGIVRRQPIYEKDRMDPVDPAATLTLDADRARRSFPEGYRHLGYLQSKNGFTVKEICRACAAQPSRGSTPRARAGSPASPTARVAAGDHDKMTAR